MAGLGYAIKTPIFRCPGGLRIGIPVIVLGLMFFEPLSWTFVNIAYLFCLGFILLFLATTAHRRAALALFGFLGVALVATAALQREAVQPLSKKITGRHFDGAPLPTVLGYISHQRQEFPVWVFMVYGEDLAQQRITLDIPEACNLEQALKLIERSAGCQFSYHWFKGCGNASEPIWAQFQVTKRGTQRDRKGAYSVFVTRDSIVTLGKKDGTNSVEVTKTEL